MILLLPEQEKVAIALIKRGANVNAVNEDGWTPLHLAARNGNYYL